MDFSGNAEGRDTEKKAVSSFQFLKRHKTGADELSVRMIPHAARDARYGALWEDS
jgi:hypothetical protein